MHKPPAFQFYTNDFLGGTVRFTAEEVGAYLLLLIEQWENGSIKEQDFEEVSRISKDKLSRVLTKFVRTKKGFINKKLEEVRRTQRKHRENNSKNGKRGAQKRWSVTTLKTNELNGEAIISPLAKNSSSSSTSSSNKEIYKESEVSKPDFLEVERVFIQQGGTKEMGKAFYDRYEAVNWKIRGSEIFKWSALVGSFITNWNLNKSNGVKVEKPVERYNFSKHGIPGRNETHD